MTTKHENARNRASRREAGLVQRIRTSLRRGFDRGETPTILIACSGGRDSVVLAQLLAALVRTGEIAAEILHVDHAVRADSAHAASVVEGFAELLGMPFHLRRLEPNIIGRHPGVGLEEALRRERYQAFAEVAATIAADAVAVGHHQRDQAETVLLHLIRGAGLAGASGMREWSDIDASWWDATGYHQRLQIWRPLLDEPYVSIEAWHEEQGLPLAEDETNLDPIFRRNAIRHGILPQLESISPGAVRNLARFAGLAAEDDACLEDQARTTLGLEGDERLRQSSLVDAGIALQRRIVRRWLLDRGFDGELTLDRIDALRELARRNRSGAVVEIGAGWSVRLDRGVLTILPPERVP